MDTRIGIVTGRTTAKNRNVGQPVRLLQVQLTDRRDIQTVQLVAQAGEECSPPNGSLVVVGNSGQARKWAVGTDDGITPVMGVGGKRIYSIDPATHAVIADIKLKPDGTIVLEGPEATVIMDPDGTITVINPGAEVGINPAGDIAATCRSLVLTTDNGVITMSQAGTLTLDVPTLHVTGDITCDGDVTASGISLVDHLHGGVQPGSGTTGVPQ